MQRDYWFNFVGARMFKLKKCLKLSIYFISFGLFLTIVLELVLDVLQEPTGTTIQIDQYESLQLPAFTICTEKAYKVPTDYVLHSIEQFDKATFSIEDIFENETIQELQSGIHFRMKETYSDLFGKCFTIQVKERVAKLEYTKHIIKFKRDQDLKIFLHEWDDIFWLILGVYPINFEVFKIKMNTFYSYFQIVLQKSETLIVNKPGRETCKNYVNDSYTSCFTKSLADYFRRKSLKCILSYWKILESSQLNVCEETQVNYTEAKEISYQIRTGFKEFLHNQSVGLCPKDCHTVSYNPKVTTFHIGYSESHKDMKTMSFNAYFADNTVKRTEEYFVYNPMNIISAFGGNLGLILGYSLLSLSLMFLDFIFSGNSLT